MIDGWRLSAARCMWPDLTVNTLRPKQNGRQFADDTFKRISLNENVRISIKISLNFVPYGPINNILALVQIMAWRRAGDKPLSEPMLVRLPTHICVTRPQWVKSTLVQVMAWYCQAYIMNVYFVKYWHRSERCFRIVSLLNVRPLYHVL